MKKLILVSLIIIQSCVAFAQNCCMNDSTIREIQFPLTEQDTKTVFCYLNNEWIAGAYLDMVPADSIQKMEVKNDEYGNRAVFLTVAPETIAEVKAEMKKRFINLDPRCEFPGGNGKLKEWIDANIKVPEGYKGCERVMVNFTVHPDGSISNPQIMKPSKNESANEEALRLVNALPKFRVKYFTPRKSNLNLCIPITFREPGAIFIRGGESSVINQFPFISSTSSPESKGNTHKKALTSNDKIDESKVFYEPEQQPYYLNGGAKGLLNDLYTTILETTSVTQECVKGRANVRFIISEDGQIDTNSIKVIRNRAVPEDYLKSAIEAIKKLGKFEPGKMNGTPLRVTYYISIIYPVPPKYIKITE